MIGLLGFAAIWGATRFMGLRVLLGWVLAVGWWLVLVALTWPRFSAVPEGAVVTDGTASPDTLVGGDARGWLALGFLTALALAYRAILRRVRARSEPGTVTLPASVPPASVPPASAPNAAFSSAELDRYARHIVLREVGGPGQRRLKDARVLVVGAGGLGSPALLYLAAAGVGTIGVIDDDTVSNSNLQRQIIHADDRIGMPKVFSAERAMKALNPFITVRPYNRRLTADIAADLFADYDLILDGSDTFATRQLVNGAAVAAGKPLLAGAIAQWEGQVTLYDPGQGAPCLACLFPQAPADGLAPTCAEAGVIGALPGVVGAMMAAEAIKEITGAGQGLRGRMLIYDALWGENRVIEVRRREGCAVCGGGPAS